MNNNTGEETAPQNVARLQGVRIFRSRILVTTILGSLSLFLATSGFSASIPIPWRAAGPVAISATLGPLAAIQRELFATNGAADDSFGYSIALQGNTAVIGAPGTTIGSNQAQGAVFVFDYADGVLDADGRAERR